MENMPSLSEPLGASCTNGAVCPATSLVGLALECSSEEVPLGRVVREDVALQQSERNLVSAA